MEDLSTILNVKERRGSSRVSWVVEEYERKLRCLIFFMVDDTLIFNDALKEKMEYLS